MAGLDWLGCGAAVREQSARIERVALTSEKGVSLFGPVVTRHSDSFLPLRSTLQNILLEQLGRENVRLGQRVGSVDKVGDQAVVHDESGAVLASGDLVVLADGIHSQHATNILGNPPAPCGYHGVLALTDHPHPAPGTGEEIWGEGNRFGLFDTGEGTYWFYMQNDGAGALDHAAVSARAAGFPERVQAVVAATAPGALIPVSIASRPLPRSYGTGRILCVGDAAHAMEPNQGQGACQGIEDGWALGVLASHVEPEQIAERFDRLRAKRIAAVHRESAMVGKAIHGSGFARKVATSAFRLVPRALDQWQLTRRITAPDYSAG